MNRIRRRAAVALAALFFCLGQEPLADFTARCVLGYLTGIHPVPGQSENPLTLGEYPAHFASDPQSYCEMFVDHQEVLRSYTGQKKRVNHGLGSLAFKKMLSRNTGLAAAWGNRSGVVSLPLSGKRIRISEVFDAHDIILSGFLKGKGISAGYTLGETVAGGSGIIQAVQIVYVLPSGFGMSVRWASTPYKWGMETIVGGISETLLSQFRYNRFETVLTFRGKGWGDLSLTLHEGTVHTHDNYRDRRDFHTLVWEADRNKWEIKAHESFVPGIDLSAAYADEAIDGDLGFWFDGLSYLRGKAAISTHRISIAAAVEDGAPSVPAFRYDRVFTDLDFRNGVADSWPFTPKQIEIIGDKTWTFSGRGKFVSNAFDCTWRIHEKTNLSLTYLLVYPDYRFRITTRDHLSINPWDMIFGKRRIETDGTRSFEFMAVMAGKRFDFGRFTFDTGISQLVPVRHVKKQVPGKAPLPPEFPRIRFERPKNFGGLNIYGSIRYPF